MAGRLASTGFAGSIVMRFEGVRKEIKNFMHYIYG
jgi:hypothetical protein